MEEYWNYIKWLGRNLYEEQIKLLGDVEISCIFHDNVTFRMLKNNLILILDCNSIQETIYKIYKNSKKIEKRFRILDISVFKGNDNIDFSETYLVSFYCVDFKTYEDNKNKYNEIFKSNLKHLKSIRNLVDEIFKQENAKLTEINNIPQTTKDININNLYSKILKNTMNKNKIYLSQLKSMRDKNKLANYEIKKNLETTTSKLLKNTDVDYIDKILKIKDNRVITGYKKIIGRLKKEKSNNPVEQLYNSNYSSIVILDCDKEEINKEFIEIFKHLNSRIIVISDNNRLYSNLIVVKSLNRALKLVEGCKAIYFGSKTSEVDCKNIININYNEIKNINEEDIINKVLENEQGIFAFAELDHINSAKVLTGTFLNFNGSNYYSGGAERYLIDLHEVCKQLGIKLRIYQKANFEFFRYYNDIEIIGISNNKEDYNYDYTQNIEILKKYNSISKNKTKLNIYSSFMECYGNAISPSVGISHGVAWDYKNNIYNKEGFKDKDWIIESAISCDKLISVDNNTANWFQTIDYKLGNTTEVVPNYVDINEFTPTTNNKEKSKFIILYPRRLYEARGMYLLLDIADKLLSKYKNIEMHFVGKGFKEDTDKIQEKIDKWGEDCIKMYNCPPTKMHEVYKKADISVIPTLFSEGTSLSCLEAMSTENAVIATRIGGLTDLVINNYNGKLIEPNSESLYSAIEEFLNNPKLMEKCKKNAREVAKEFNKDVWIEKWKKIIKANSKKVTKNENIYYNIVMIYTAEKNLKSAKIKKVILEKLMQNNLVYIVNNNVNKKDSYGRLQYIKENEDLYRNPDVILVDNEYENKDNIKENYIEI